MICPKCKGNGRAGGRTAVNTSECARCNGTGQIPDEEGKSAASIPCFTREELDYSDEEIAARKKFEEGKSLSDGITRVMGFCAMCGKRQPFFLHPDGRRECESCGAMLEHLVKLNGLDTISITAFRQAPGDVLMQVELGETIIITRQGKPFAVLSKLPGVQLCLKIDRHGKESYIL